MTDQESLNRDNVGSAPAASAPRPADRQAAARCPALPDQVGPAMIRRSQYPPSLPSRIRRTPIARLPEPRASRIEETR